MEKLQTVCIEIPANDPQAMEQFQKVMDAIHEDTNDYIQQMAKEMNISQACAMDVWYLRSRSRHTPELEAELIRLHSIGNPPNVMEFGHDNLPK